MAGLLEWDALPLFDRLAALRMGPAIRLAHKSVTKPGVVAASPGETVQNWLIRNGQTATTREMLWEPLALAALNQSPATAAAPTFVRVLGTMFGNEARDAAIGVPARPLSMMYAEPARAYIEGLGGHVRTGAPARVQISGDAVQAVEVAGQRMLAGVVVAAVPWFALGDLFSGAPESLRPLLANAAATSSCPLATVNLWLDRPVLDVPFVGLPGRAMQWVFDKRIAFGGEASHLSLVSSVADSLADVPDDQLIERATAEVLDAIPAARAASVVRATVVREKRATFSLAPGQPPRPGTSTPIVNLLLAGDWIDTGLPATIESAVVSGHRAADAVPRAH
jgi:hydroxysqualene dehydroxylase